MDAYTQLAVMAKAKRVFESEDTFLSFPALSPITCDPDELRFAAPGEMTPQLLAAMSEFARITNAIPRGAIAPQEEGEYLWDVYGDVLETAQLAAGDLSPAETARWEQAISALYVRSPDGVQSDSPALTTYKQYRDAHISALEDYKNAQFTAESSEDAATQARWRDEDEPRLRQEVKRCEDAWLTDGRKADIEEALQVEQACAARAPALIWDAWKTSFMADLDTQTDTNLINYASTGFSPYDFADGDSWPRFTLTRPEMRRLVEAAPADLVDVLGSSAEEDIQRVSFEYRSVAVTRPWFRPTLFKSRIWRLPDSAEGLSEGSDPPRGRCPAYISAIVFARNMNIDRGPGRTSPPARPARPGEQPGRDPRTAAARPRVRDHRDVGRDHRDPDRGRPHVVRDHRSNPAQRPQPAGVRHVAPQFTARPRAGGSTTAVARRPARVDRVGFQAIPRRPGVPETRVETTPRPPESTTSASGLTIVAFICKRLPRCPDPDPGLTWTL